MAAGPRQRRASLRMKRSASRAAQRHREDIFILLVESDQFSLLAFKRAAHDKLDQRQQAKREGQQVDQPHNLVISRSTYTTQSSDRATAAGSIRLRVITSI